jgi:hypothetical protein
MYNSLMLQFHTEVQISLISYYNYCIINNASGFHYLINLQIINYRVLSVNLSCVAMLLAS